MAQGIATTAHDVEGSKQRKQKRWFNTRKAPIANFCIGTPNMVAHVPKGGPHTTSVSVLPGFSSVLPMALQLKKNQNYQHRTLQQNFLSVSSLLTFQRLPRKWPTKENRLFPREVVEKLVILPQRGKTVGAFKAPVTWEHRQKNSTRENEHCRCTNEPCVCVCVFYSTSFWLWLNQTPRMALSAYSLCPFLARFCWVGIREKSVLAILTWLFAKLLNDKVKKQIIAQKNANVLFQT